MKQRIRLPKWVQESLHTGREAGTQFVADKGPRLAAALAYYTLVSLIPMLYLILVTVSLVFDPGVARETMLLEMQDSAGADVAQLVGDALGLVDAGSGAAGILIGGALMLLAATTVLGELQNGLNQVWGLQAPKGKPWMRIVRERGLSLLLVLTMGVLLALSIALEAAVSGLFPEGAWQAFPLVDALVSVSGLTVFLAAVYKVLPDARIRWADVWLGALLTALLLGGGKVLIAYYVGHSATASAYGAAGALAVLLIWVYLAGMLFFFGAEVTEIRAARRHAILPRRGAIRVLPQRIPLPLELAPTELTEPQQGPGAR